MLNTDVVDQPDAPRLQAAETDVDDATPVPELTHAGMIAGEPGKVVDAVDISTRAWTARATNADAVSDHGSNVAEEPDIQASLPIPRTPAPRRHRNKSAESAAGPQLANAPTVTAQAISLDDDIKLLRSELVGKLRLQNAQLKTMLERFER
ncbi:hypothetical protein ABID16_004344 [Rhizobium aquaticum]|uniref:Uncharacterized protein n=1 Tax=Rhizobium aquaticum TaxID=1549636 RepID=A0ABV2J7V0_9HYPH